MNLFFVLKEEDTPLTYVKKRNSPRYSLEDLQDAISDFTNQNITFKRTLPFKEVLKRFKETEQAKPYKGTKKKRVNVLIIRISVEDLKKK